MKNNIANTLAHRLRRNFPYFLSIIVFAWLAIFYLGQGEFPPAQAGLYMGAGMFLTVVCFLSPGVPKQYKAYRHAIWVQTTMMIMLSMYVLAVGERKGGGSGSRYQ